jgi:hypothetical protein
LSLFVGGLATPLAHFWHSRATKEKGISDLNSDLLACRPAGRRGSAQGDKDHYEHIAEIEAGSSPGAWHLEHWFNRMYIAASSRDLKMKQNLLCRGVIQRSRRIDREAWLFGR